MGSLQASEMANLADLDTALTWHLRGNHYPPVPIDMLEPCKQAIWACNDGDYYREIDLPDGTTYRGSTQATASQIVDGLRLYSWIEDENE